MNNDDVRVRLGRVARMCEEKVVEAEFDQAGRLVALAGCFKAKDFRRR